MCAGVKSLLFASIYPLGMLTLLQWLSASEKSDPCDCQLLQSELSDEDDKSLHNTNYDIKMQHSCK